jgi:sugar-specific transcriptional regulator TrmB
MVESRENMTGKYEPIDPNSPIWEDRRAHTRISNLEERLNVFEKKLDANTEATQTIATNTTEIVQLIKGAKGFRNFLLWVTPIAAFVALLWSFLKEHWK